MFRQKAPSSYHNACAQPFQKPRADPFDLEKVIEAVEGAALRAVLDDAPGQDRADPR
jgi:hypothetical protein